MTEIVQPIDTGYRRSLRCKIRNLLDEWLMDPKNLLRWETKITVSERRVLVFYLIGEANENILKEDNDEIRVGCFRRTGYLITAKVDEELDRVIKSQGVTVDFINLTTLEVRAENNEEINTNAQHTDEEGVASLNHYLEEDNENDNYDIEIDI